MPEQEQSLFWQALDYLNRPSAAVMGGARAAIVGEDPLQAAYRGLVGTDHYSGQDVLGALGADPNSTLTKVGGFAMDVLNPLDPLNYIGVGELTKAGKAAHALGKLGEYAPEAARLADGIGNQARAGQRALMTFAGQPVIKGAPVLDAFGKVGSYLAESPMGKSVQTMFGGKYGKYLATTPDAPDVAKAAVDLNMESGFRNNLMMHQANQIMEPLIKGLKGSEDADLLETIAKHDRGDMSFEEATQAFTRPSEKGYERRLKAWQAAQDAMKFRAENVSTLDGTGVGAFAEDKLGYMPRLVKGIPMDAKFGLGPLTGAELAADLTGASRNPINYGLLQKSTEPFAVATLTEEGKKLWDAEKGGMKKWNAIFDPNSKFFDPEKIKKLSSMRMTPKELNAIPGMPVSYNTRASLAFKSMFEQAAENIKYDQMMKSLEKKGVAQPWVEAIHGKTNPATGLPEFAKVDQGRYASYPLAVPWDTTQAFGRLQDAMMPSPRTATLGALVNSVLPESFKDIKPLAWWKGMAIFGGGPSYFARNFATGLIKNRVEGVRIHDYANTFNNLMKPIFTGNLNDTVVKLPGSGIELTAKQLVDEYIARNMAGGGMPDIDIIEGASPAAMARKKVFGGLHKANEQVEMALRMPLMLKSLDDTVMQAQKHGIPLDKALDAGFANAKDKIDRVHFDYTNLTDVEKRIRDTMIPFYAWSRFNIPEQTVSMLTHPGKYMPFVRAYYQGVQQSGLTREDMPEWLKSNFAIPIGKTEDGRQQYVDLTGFLPFMDVAELAAIAVPFFTPGEQSTDPNKSDRQQMLTWAAAHMNPVVTKAAEQALGKEFLTGKDFGVTPKEMFGVTVRPEDASAAQMVRPVMEVDRLNPTAGGLLGATAGAIGGRMLTGGPMGMLSGLGLGLMAGTQYGPGDKGLITQLGQSLGTFTSDQRPHRNEPDAMARATRTALGIKTFGVDPDAANMSQKQRDRLSKQYAYRARKAFAAGNVGEGQYFVQEMRKLKGND